MEFLLVVAAIGVYIWLDNVSSARKARQDEIERNKEIEEWVKTNSWKWED